MSGSVARAPSPFRQPRAVYAVGFACVISFMGIGLVDPILPALASRLKASPATIPMTRTMRKCASAVLPMACQSPPDLWRRLSFVRPRSEFY